jgi:hypothetical protein
MTDKPDGKRWRGPVLTLVFSCVHLFVIFVLFVVLCGPLMEGTIWRAIFGGTKPFAERLAEGIMLVLCFPLVDVFCWMHLSLPGIVDVAIVVLNSVLWGSCAAWLIVHAPRRKKVVAT